MFLSTTGIILLLSGLLSYFLMGTEHGPPNVVHVGLGNFLNGEQEVILYSMSPFKHTIDQHGSTDCCATGRTNN